MQSSTRSSNSDPFVNDEKIQEKNESLERKVFPMQAVAYDDDGFPIEETIGKDICHPWRYKGPALACILLLTLGSNFAGSALSPLKSTLIKELKINNAQYGVISSASSLINAVLPIFSGIAIDYYGSSWGSMVSSIFIFIGAILGGVGASTKSYGLIVGGQIIMGFGSTTIETAQSKLYTHWFRGTAKGSVGVLALVYGLDIGIGRVYNVVGKATAVPIQISTGSWTWSFWVPAILCGVTVFINAAYVVFERRLPARHQIVTGRMLSAESEKAGVKSPHGPGFKGALNKAWDVITLSIRLIPAAFWILPLTQLLQAGTVNAYTSNLADIIKVTRFSSTLTAGYTSAIGQIIPILLTPVIGFLFDLYGRRTAYISFTAALWVLVFGLLGFTSVHPMAPTILGSVALAFNSIPFIASIPLLVPSQASIGVAFGIWKCFN
nr:MFS general substrate transporter [Phaffia rhodozyma]